MKPRSLDQAQRRVLIAAMVGCAAWLVIAVLQIPTLKTSLHDGSLGLVGILLALWAVQVVAVWLYIRDKDMTNPWDFWNPDAASRERDGG